MTPAAHTAPERPRVLLVDDERELLESLRTALEVEFDIETAPSAMEAEMLMAARRYDVVVSDHLMAGSTGLEFLIRAQERHPRTQRIMVTGYMNPELISRSVSLAGLATCLVKPLHAAQISSAIWGSLGRK
jgi:DNA-binding NtrC family response regulator